MEAKRILAEAASVPLPPPNSDEEEEQDDELALVKAELKEKKAEIRSLNRDIKRL